MELIHIQNKIYELRGQKVMLDFDLAALYGVETKNLNLSVKRNLKRFPPDFMFQLSTDEWESLRLQFETSKRGGRRYVPYAFTEHGVTMLSGVLRSDTAIKINIQIVRAFIVMRQLILKNPDAKITELQSEINALKEYIEEVFTDYNDYNDDTRIQLELINQSLAELQTDRSELKKPRRRIGYEASENE